MSLIREFAPAKINLTLEVLGKRPDGYHELKSLVAFADVGDVITLDTTRSAGVEVSGPFAGSIAGANLIETTLRLIAEAAPELRLGAVHLEKNLPVAAGIGGGSADAAAVIRAVQNANPGRAADIDWKSIAMRIGADVPVCIVSQLAWMSGIGEIVAPLKLDEPARLAAVVVNPLIAVPEDKTARVFRMLAAGEIRCTGQPEDNCGIESRESVLKYVVNGRNDLAAAAVQTMPGVSRVISGLSEPQVGAMFVRMSGAGPTCFAIFEDRENAVTAAAKLQSTHPDWWVRAASLG